MTHTQNTPIRPIQLSVALAVVVLCASSSHASSVNLQGLKSSFTYTPFAGESLERIIAKTMPNTELKQEVVAEAFRALNPQQFSNLIENQVSQKKPQNMLTGTTPAAPKINPKTESWVRLPAKMVALTQKMENWIRYPGPAYSESTASAESKTWVRYLGGHVNTLLSGDIANSPTADWVRYPSASSQNLAISTSTPIDQSEWVRYVAKN